MRAWGKSSSLIMPKIHQTRFPVTFPVSPRSQQRTFARANFLRTCYGETGVMGFWFNSVRHFNGRMLTHCFVLTCESQVNTKQCVSITAVKGHQNWLILVPIESAQWRRLVGLCCEFNNVSANCSALNSFALSTHLLQLKYSIFIHVTCCVVVVSNYRWKRN